MASNRIRGVVLLRRVMASVGERERALIEPSEETVWISRAYRARRYTVAGVPGRLLTIIGPEPGSAQWDGDIVCDVQTRRGRYDGAERPSLLLRPISPDDGTNGILSDVDDVDDVCELLIRRATDGRPDPEGVGAIVDLIGCDVSIRVATIARVWRHELDEDGDLSRIAGWHATRYYTHLGDSMGDAIEQATHDLLVAVRERDDITLAEANRIVSRSLYRASRDLGWRKLTQRERIRHGLGVDHPQWVRESHLATVSPVYAGRATGVGDWTDAAARMSPEIMIVRREYLDA